MMMTKKKTKNKTMMKKNWTLMIKSKMIVYATTIQHLAPPIMLISMKISIINNYC
ncbi:hypothetical protein MG5_03067 [Candida albicans P57072]|nr:hypothetical protein MG5_03067 [Candida albicans P57072]KHC37308.1 Hap43p-repressed protein [Candida albicans P76067]